MRAVVASGLVVAAAACSDTVEPGPPKTLQGRILIVSEQTGFSRIVSTKPDGSDGYQLPIALAGHLTQPDIHPDGIQVAFVHQFDLYAAGFEDGEPSLLVSDAGLDVAPDWSPDGRELAFASDRTGLSDIYVVAVDGGALRRLTSAPGREDSPQWSPDGTWISFERDVDGRYEVAMVRPDGSDERQLETPNGGGVPTWSPDGSEIAYIDAMLGGIRIQNVTTGSDRVLLEDEPLIVAIAWKPNGQEIAYAAGGDTWIIDVASGEIRPLVATEYSERDVEWGPEAPAE